MITHLVFDGVADGALGVGLDVVGAAARLVAAGVVSVPARPRQLRQRVVSIDGRPVRSGADRVIAVDGALALRGLTADDVIVIPGLGAATDRLVDHLLARADIRRGATILARAAGRKVVLAASCSATFAVAASGALDGREATTTWWLRGSFARRFPSVRLSADRMVVESRGIFTAGAALAHADLMLAIVARRISPSLAHLVARYLVLDERVSQARYMVMEHLRSSDPVVHALEDFVTANIDRQVSLAEMAAFTATSPRTLARRLQSGPPPRDHERLGRACRRARWLRRRRRIPPDLPPRARDCST